MDDANLLSEFRDLWLEAEQIWNDRQDDAAFERYVSADYSEIYGALCNLRGRIRTVLEWGSGLGVVTIMAARMGFEAYGIEAESELVDLAEQISRDFQASATFAVGSFIPDQFQWDPGTGDEFHRTIDDSRDGYDELDLELRDFDLVYAYPWPTERSLYETIMRQYGNRNALLMLYDAREGLSISRG